MIIVSIQSVFTAAIAISGLPVLLGRLDASAVQPLLLLLLFRLVRWSPLCSLAGGIPLFEVHRGLVCLLLGENGGAGGRTGSVSLLGRVHSVVDDHHTSGLDLGDA